MTKRPPPYDAEEDTSISLLTIPMHHGSNDGVINVSEDEGDLVIGQVLGGEVDAVCCTYEQVVQLIPVMQEWARNNRHKLS